MTSFALRIEPAPQPRLAAGFLLLHAAVAILPWAVRCPAWLSFGLSFAALSGLACSLTRVPGHHCRLRGFAVDSGDCRARLAADPDWREAKLGPGCRVSRAWVLLDLRIGPSRAAWLLSKSAVPPGPFRRLKARIRLAC